MAFPTPADFGEKKHSLVTSVHNLGPPPKRRKHDQNALASTDVISPTKRSATPRIPPKRSVIELDSDGEEIVLNKVGKCSPLRNTGHSYRPKQKAKKESSSDDDSESEYATIHAGFDLRESRIVSPPPGGLDNNNVTVSSGNLPR